MESIINSLFEEVGLEAQLTEFGKVYYFGNANQFSFWLVIETTDLSSIIENQSKFFTVSKELLKNEWFDKNANLLILCKSSLESPLDKNQLIDIEENPFLFKKQILFYTENEKQKLLEAITASNLTTKKFFEQKLLSNSIFEQHKTNLNNNAFESLLYRVAHKVPFLNIKVIQKDGLSALTEKNNIDVEKNSQLKELDDLISEMILDKKFDEVSAISAEAVYEKILIVINKDEDSKD
ncbi:ABC-three component system middle component 1 [Kaistella sp.]|uniref:ABC-three component system middle component 1 n=1 Tax=Kaistella sp. TaxID=2782235 RepID=UPI003C3F7D98